MDCSDAGARITGMETQDYWVYFIGLALVALIVVVA
jgi:LPXTG-motif cell wall-anchored protein